MIEFKDGRCSALDIELTPENIGANNTDPTQSRRESAYSARPLRQHTLHSTQNAAKPRARTSAPYQPDLYALRMSTS